jgi:hypothetical protein
MPKFLRNRCILQYLLKIKPIPRIFSVIKKNKKKIYSIQFHFFFFSL